MVLLDFFEKMFGFISYKNKVYCMGVKWCIEYLEEVKFIYLVIKYSEECIYYIFRVFLISFCCLVLCLK